MGIFTPFEPEITSGSLENFGFHKLKRQIKSIYVNIIRDFFDFTKKIHKLEIAELSQFTSKEGRIKIFVERDFPFYERKIPLITPTIVSLNEKKPYLGIDDYLYPEVYTAPDGKRFGFDVYAGMAEPDIQLIVATESPDLRDTLSEMLFMCFTHYYRGYYVYNDSDGGMYNIAPSTRPVVIGDERELTDEDKTTLIYAVGIGIRAFIEYHFKAVGEDRYEEINKIKVNENGDPEDPWDPVITY